MSDNKKLSTQQIMKNRTDTIMNIIAKRAAYYRANPQRFVAEYLGIRLKLFQKILIWAMMHNDNFYYVASRGQGKTYLVALFCVVRCILFPGTKVKVASYTFKQAKEVLLKITEDFMHNSALLRTEIEKISTGQNDCYIYFKDGSWIRVCVAGESARGGRSNIIIVDESRMVTNKVVQDILRPMNADARHPAYLDKPQYAHLQEVNKEFHMSSAYYAQSEMFDNVKSYVSNMLNPNLKFFVCDLPYQLSIAENLLMRQLIENEMSQQTFSDISFMMEREGLFYGSATDALFDFKTLNDRRILEDSLHDLDYYRDNNLRIPEKQKGEIRILSVDIALMASKKHDNDASALIIHSAIPTSSHNYMDNVVYIDTQEGLVTEELGLLIMRYFNQYDCDYIAIDANGVGLSVCDFLMADRFDPIYGQSYNALDCVDNPEMSERCKVKGAPKVIYAIKATSRMNNDMCLSLRSGFQNGYINLLCSDTNIDEKLSKIRGYSKLNEIQQARLRFPYVQTTLLINELINLTHDTSNGLIKVKERPGMRKDRYSSLEYGYYVVQELSKKLKPKQQTDNLLDLLTIRPARKVGSF